MFRGTLLKPLSLSSEGEYATESHAPPERTSKDLLDELHKAGKFNKVISKISPGYISENVQMEALKTFHRAPI